MFDFEEALKLISKQTVLCVGDLMLDDFVYGEVTRISPEAPTPVLAVARSEVEIGGAGNVARNIAALGAHCIFVGLIGNDQAGLTLTDALGKFDDLIVPDLVIDKARQTTRKVRFVSEQHSAHLMRADWETTAPTSAHSEDSIIGYAETAMQQAGAVMLSDYAKGTLTPRVIRAIIDAARRHGKPVVVDPKGHDYSVYRGATIDYAEPSGTRRRGASPGHDGSGNCQGGGRAGAPGREPGGAGDPKRGRHDAPPPGSCASPYFGLSRKGARRLRRRRYRRGGNGGTAGDAGAVRIRHARRQCRRRRGGRQ